MAARFACLALLLFALASCQQQPPAESLPPLTFDGPALVNPATAPSIVAPVVAAPKVTAPAVVARARTVPRDDVPREWVPGIDARPWRWIIIHHSATSFGNAQIIDGWHRDKGWDELGYHFVVCNGSSSPDGEIQVGPRWIKQKWGAHTKTADNRFNDFGIGICLVGNFDESRPTEAQMRSVARLVAHLMKTYHIPADRIIGHGDAKPTDCPGRYMSVADVRRRATQILADAGESPDTGKLAASDELMKDSEPK